MNLIKVLKSVFVSLAALALAVGCERDLTIEGGDAVLKILGADDAPVTAVQSFSFGSSLKFKIEAQNIASTEVSVPGGWSCDISIPSREIKIGAPAEQNVDAALRGDVVVTAHGINGTTATATVSVEVSERAIELFCKEDVSQPVQFRVEETKRFSFEASDGVAEVRISKQPKGWTLQMDNDKLTLDVTAPADPAGVDAEGEIVLTPYSLRETEGKSVTINVTFDAGAPILVFEQTQVWLKRGETRKLAVERMFNVDHFDTASMEVPAGWVLTPDFAARTVTLTAPSGYVQGGKIVIPIVSAGGRKDTAYLDVALGIADADDFDALDKAVAGGQNLDGLFAIEGTVKLIADVKLSGKDLFVGSDGAAFSATFDGDGHTITYDIEAASKNVALFHTLGEGAAVENLKLAGKISTSLGGNISAVSIYNDGASLTNIDSAVSFTSTSTDNSGYYGSMASYVRKSGAKFEECHSTGAINVKGIKFLGALIGNIESGTTGSMNNCSNSGNLNLNYGEGDGMGGAYVGGCVGNTLGSDWNYKNISNTGNIDYTFGKSNKTIHSLGGLFGSACGYFENCFNKGHVLDADGDDTVAGTRRIGGFAGSSASSGHPINAVHCWNEGAVSGVSNYIAGFIGILESSTESAPNNLTDCWNAGDLRVVSKTTISGMFGGLLAVSYNYTNLTGCRNSGRVIGYSNRSAGGLVGCGADFLQIDGCENTGEVYVACTVAANPNAGRPFVAGIVAARGTLAAVPLSIRNSKNTGAITAWVNQESHVASAYVWERVTVDGDTDAIVCDEATRQASAGAKVTAVLRPEWGTAVFPY